METRLTQIIQGQIEEYWNKTAQASAERAARELKIEQDEHERFGRERGGVDSFVGRESELKRSATTCKMTQLCPLVVHGASGCGKTALLARAAEEMQNAEGRRQKSEVIVRFIGVTPRSSDIRSLLGNLCQELRLRHPRESALPTDIKELSDELHQHLQAATPEQPLILFLDALDQLAEADNDRILHWLPTGSLPAHVKLVLSCLPDRVAGDPAGQPYAEFKSRQILAGNFIYLDALSDAEARTLLFDRWLPQARRTLNQNQRVRIEHRLRSATCRQPIYLKLLFEEARLWRSYDEVRTVGEDLPALLSQFFERLRQPTNHGALLVDRMVGYLAASRHGLAENEILEILFADPEFKAELEKGTEEMRHEMPPNATRIPIALWSRIRFDVAAYLTERAATGANVLTFYHRQVAEWVQEHFVKGSEHTWQPHRRLADYFRALADPERNQSWKGESPRPFLELPWQLAQAGQHEKLKAYLTNFKLLHLILAHNEIDAVAYWRRLCSHFDMSAEFVTALQDRHRDGTPDEVSRKLYAASAFLQMLASHEAAVVALRSVLDFDEQTFGRNSPQVVRDLSSLALELDRMERPEESGRLFARIVDILRAFSPINTLALATALSNLGLHHAERGQAAQAKRYWQDALQTLDMATDSETTTLANILFNASAYDSPHEAVPKVRRALQIVERFYGRDHPHTALYLNCLAGHLV